MSDDGIAYVILDDKHTRIPNYRLLIRTDQLPITADALTDLADKLGIPADTLTETMAHYNQACGRAPIAAGA